MDLAERLQESLKGSATITRELGGGGMSRVFVATENNLRRDIVIKVLAPELSGSVSIDRFKREISLVAGLQHPHIVPLFAAGEVDGLPYYTMPLVRGRSLREHIADAGEIPLRFAIRVLRDVASALHYAHEQGVVHRDIKPGNVLVSADNAMVVDFGFAKALSAAAGPPHEGEARALTSTGVSVGTPMYMAPEQAFGNVVDHRADIYAFGVLAYEVLAGQPPFNAQSVQGLVVAHATTAPVPLLARRRGMPPSIAALVMRCLAKSPDDRPGSAAEIVEALDLAVRGLPPDGRVGSGARPRSMILATLAVTGLALALLIPRRPTPEPDSSGATISSLGVLPFDALGDTAIVYFADGVTQELGLALARIPGVNVASRTSMRALRGKTPAEAAAMLKVDAVLEGSVRRTGSRLRIVASLVRASNGFVVWTNGYDNDTTDAFAVQDSVARAVAAALQRRISPEVAERLAPRGTRSVRAHDLVLRGRALVDRYTENSLRTAVGLFEEAISLDSNYADAWTGLRAALGRLTDSWVAPHETMPRMREAFERALRLDPVNAEAHSSAGAYYFNWQRDFAAAERAFVRALSLDSSSVVGGVLYAHVLSILGRVDSSTAVASRAVRLNPLSYTVLREAVRTYIWNMRLDSAAALCPRLAELAPSGGDECNARVLTAEGRFAEALAITRRLAPANPVGVDHIVLAVALARSGERTEARRALARAEEYASNHYVAGDRLAEAYAALGMNELAIASLERALRDDAAGIAYLAVNPAFQRLAQTAAFQSVLQRSRRG